MLIINGINTSVSINKQYNLSEHISYNGVVINGVMWRNNGNKISMAATMWRNGVTAVNGAANENNNIMWHQYQWRAAASASAIIK